MDEQTNMTDATREAIEAKQKEEQQSAQPSMEDQMARMREVLSTPISEEDAARQLADLDMREAWANMVLERARAEVNSIEHQISAMRCARAEIKVRMLVPAKKKEEEEA